ncbi:MAG TPA: hypothetical protein VIR81_11770 [Myxococcales bacterium]
MIALSIRRRWRVLPACLALPLLPLLGGCGNSAGYPSLARLPAERVGASGLERGCDCPPGRGPARGCEGARVTGTAPVVAPVVVSDGGATASAAVGVAALVADAREAHARFESRRAAAVAAVSAASGAAPTSEAWLRANQALVELDRARAESGAALVGLDRIAIDDRLAHALDDPDGTADRPGAQAIRDGLARVGGWVGDEDAALDALKRKFVGDDK